MYLISIFPDDSGLSFGYNKPLLGKSIISVGNLLASYGISIGGMSKKKKRENGESQNGNGSSNNSKQAHSIIEVRYPLTVEVGNGQAIKIDPITQKPIAPISGRLETT